MDFNDPTVFIRPKLEIVKRLVIPIKVERRTKTSMEEGGSNKALKEHTLALELVFPIESVNPFVVRTQFPHTHVTNVIKWYSMDNYDQ